MSVEGTPHTHQPVLTREYASIQAGAWYLQYGHIKVHLCLIPYAPYRRTARKLRRIIRKATTKAVLLHDLNMNLMNEVKPPVLDKKAVKRTRRQLRDLEQ